MESWCSYVQAENTRARHPSHTRNSLTHTRDQLDFQRLCLRHLYVPPPPFPLLGKIKIIHITPSHAHSTDVPCKRQVHPAPARALPGPARDAKSACERVHRRVRTLA